jgi:hypothetical protein
MDGKIHVIMQLDESLAAVDLKLTAEQRARLDAAR